MMNRRELNDDLVVGNRKKKKKHQRRDKISGIYQFIE